MEIKVVPVIPMEVIFFQNSVRKGKKSNRLQRKLVKWEAQFIDFVGGVAVRAYKGVSMEWRFDKVEHETDDVFEFDNFDVRTLITRYLETIRQFLGILSNAFADEKNIIPGEELNKSLRRAMDVNGVVGLCLKLDKDVAFPVLAFEVVVGKAD